MHVIKVKSLIICVATLLSFSHCNNQKLSNGEMKTFFYKDFDIFKLKGSDALKKINKNQSVEVRYNDSFPVYIKYYRPDRTVTLILEDSFKLNDNQPVYIYSTGNFHGGKPGRHRVYSSHYEEYNDLIFVSCTDTIICKTYQIPDSIYLNYTLYLYMKTGNIILKHQGGGDKKLDNGLSKEELYQAWFKALKKGFQEYNYPYISVKELPE